MLIVWSDITLYQYQDLLSDDDQSSQDDPASQNDDVISDSDGCEIDMNNLTLMLRTLCEVQGGDVPSILGEAQDESSISSSSRESSDVPDNGG